ncbi:RNA ligase family protein [Bradyrhizobium sp. SEMIA]|uniref:ATP-dependent DNA ligase n=1 Tax=Bradyrhizobium sp. SEMIA TaxID=2597515 RepID=UPI002ACE757B|nr:RNA ligase family protein [Bradyrhizobium sp. SEMIA]
MRKAFEFCLPTAANSVPDGPDWIHEVKYDGYRLMVVRQNDRVRLLTRNGHDWTKRYPLIIEAALKNRQKHFVIDGEAVVLTMTGIPDWDALHSRKHDDEVQLYAFDILAGDGNDYRRLPLKLRKPAAARPPRGHFRRTVRAGRDRPRPVPARLPAWPGRLGVQAWQPRLSRGPLRPLDQGEEP